MDLLKQNPQVLFTELDDGTGILLHLESKFYFTMNKTAVFVWKTIGLQSGISADEIIEIVIRTFRVEKDQAERDVHGLLNEMKADALVLTSA